MSSALDLSRVTIGITMGFAGISLNSFIVAVNLRDWQEGVHLSSCDLVLSLIGLTNVFVQIDLVLDTVFRGFQNYIKFAREIHLRILSILIFLASCNYWFTVWLCTFYCLRIVNFTSGLLFLLKMRISRYLPRLLVISVVESCSIAVPVYWNMHLGPPHDSGQNASSHQVISIMLPYKVIMMCGTIAPLILTLIPTALTLKSLWRHIMMMQENMPGSSNTQTRAHKTAARTMVLLLALHILFYMVSISVILHSFNVDDISQHFCWLVVFSYSTLQALIIIKGNSKLSKSGKRIVKQLGDWYQTFHGNHPGLELQDSTVNLPNAPGTHNQGQRTMET